MAMGFHNQGGHIDCVRRQCHLHPTGALPFIYDSQGKSRESRRRHVEGVYI